MGYDLHICRSESNPIALVEWKEYVSGDAELKAEEVFEVQSPKGERISIPGKGLARWIAHPHGQNFACWFDWRTGKISVRDPDEPTLTKMRAIAQELGARVQGDEGEYYDWEAGNELR